MKYRIASDIHSEFWDENPAKAKRIIDMVLPPLDTDATSTLLLAGDTGSARRGLIYAAIIEHLCTRFPLILDIPGNHYWYGAEFGIEETRAPYKHKNYRFSTGIQTPYVTACTLWTDFNKENPMDMHLCMRGMNDYRQIPNHTPEKVLAAHKTDLLWLRECVTHQHTLKGTTPIIMTHHAPSFKSIAPKYQSGPYASINSGYASNLEDLILELKPVLWVHGHIHSPSDYMIGDTRVVCNPIGYFDERNPIKNVVVDI